MKRLLIFFITVEFHVDVDFVCPSNFRSESYCDLSRSSFTVMFSEPLSQSEVREPLILEYALTRCQPRFTWCVNQWS